MSDVTIPEWVATLVGRLILENELLRRRTQEFEQPASTPSEGSPT